MTTLFISDLHLNEERPDIARAFLRFLINEAMRADKLYILGDFFEVWVGDDDDSAFVNQVKSALKQTTNSGTQVFVMHGNRDFLLGQAFADDTGVELISDPTIINLYGKAVLLMHGDSLCTGDEEYQQFRAVTRSEEWQRELMEKTLEERRSIAAAMRNASKERNENIAQNIMDVTEAEVVTQMNYRNTKILIHGHTHRPAIHDIQLDSIVGKRYVLGDWCEKGWVIRATSANDIELESFEI